MPRKLVDVLRQPQTDAEERAADEHIRRACEEIKARWTNADHRRRAPRPTRWRLPETATGAADGTDER